MFWDKINSAYKFNLEAAFTLSNLVFVLQTFVEVIEEIFIVYEIGKLNLNSSELELNMFSRIPWNQLFIFSE